MFLRACESTGRDWRTVTYREDLLAWQTGLFPGNADPGKPLTESTTNNLWQNLLFLDLGRLKCRAKICLAIIFAKVSYRRTRFSFKVGMGKGARHIRKDVDARVGALVPRPSKLHLPSPPRGWTMDEGRCESGVVMKTMMSIILGPGIGSANVINEVVRCRLLIMESSRRESRS